MTEICHSFCRLYNKAQVAFRCCWKLSIYYLWHIHSLRLSGVLFAHLNLENLQWEYFISSFYSICVNSESRNLSLFIHHCSKAQKQDSVKDKVLLRKLPSYDSLANQNLIICIISDVSVAKPCDCSFHAQFIRNFSVSKQSSVSHVTCNIVATTSFPWGFLNADEESNPFIAETFTT